METSSDLPRISSVIFGNLRKFSENVRKRLSGLTTFGESSESDRRSLERFETLGKWLKRCRNWYAELTREISSLTLEDKIRIYAQACT